MDGFLNEGWRDISVIAGVALTVIGFAIAFFQLWRVKSTADAAAAAARETRDSLIGNMQLSYLTSALGLVGEIGSLIRSEEFDAAHLRLGDLRELTVQIRAGTPRPEPVEARFQGSIAQIASLEDTLLERHYNRENSFDPVAIHSRLRELADFFNAQVAEARVGRVATGGGYSSRS